MKERSGPRDGKMKDGITLGDDGNFFISGTSPIRKERGILYTPENIQLILDDLKRQTRCRIRYEAIWSGIHGYTGEDSWAANPYVWAISFTRIEP